MSWPELPIAARTADEPLAPQIRRRAARAVAANARSVSEAARLLEMLGFSTAELTEMAAARPAGHVDGERGVGQCGPSAPGGRTGRSRSTTTGA